jgi:uncharacterized protein
LKKPPIFDYLLLKVASRCNLNCTYCYWFRDKSVYERPRILDRAVENALLDKLAAHINTYKLNKFSILFHGGEPLLLGKERVIALSDRLRRLEQDTGCRLDLSITTNGVLVDDEWAAIFRECDISPTISLDGPRDVHDAVRVDHGGRGSYEKVLRGLAVLRSHDIDPGVLAVCDPSSSPDDVIAHFVEKLGLNHFDIMIPDATYEDKPMPIAPYYIRLFDIWYDEYARRGVEVRFLNAMLMGVLGGNAHIESIGYGPIQTCTMLTDGALEPLDVLRIAGYRTTATPISILTHTFQDVTADPTWRAAFDASLNLCSTCNACEYKDACGGGYLPHRWSKQRNYNNPSVYCEDLMKIFDHIWARAAADIAVVTETQSTPLNQAVRELAALS